MKYWYFTTVGNYSSSEGDYYRIQSAEDTPPIATPFEAQKCPAGVLPPPEIHPVNPAVPTPTQRCTHSAMIDHSICKSIL